MGKKIVFTPEQLEELKSLMAQNMRQTDIAKHFGVTDDTIRRICRENELEIKMPYKCICIICGDVFYSNRPDAKTCKKEHHRTCVVCGKDFIVDRWDIRDTCSGRCTSLKHYGTEHPRNSETVKSKARQTCLEIYGVDNPGKMLDHKEKIEATSLEKYGAKNYASTQECQEKRKATNLKKFGCEEPLADLEYRARIDQINLEKYGTVHPMQTDEIKEKQRSTMQERYGVDNPMQSPEIIEHFQYSLYEKYGYRHIYQIPEIKEKISNTCIERYGVKWACMRPETRNFSSNNSGPNRMFAQLLDEHNISYEKEFHIEGYSYDFKCGDVLVEINPTATHNTIMSIHPKAKPVTVDYHLNKTQKALDSGFRCLNVFEWDDLSKILTMLQPRKRIYARKCVVQEIDVAAASRFINMYHIQGQCRGSVTCLSLIYKGEIVEVMTFGRPRYSTQCKVELLRLCSKSDLEVVGGASKLFKHYVKNYHPESIISYCDSAKFSGSVYKQIGMKLDHCSNPAKIWSKGTAHITDNLLRQRGYDQLFGTNYGKGTSNEQLMLDNKWLPVYDCGQKVFVYEPEESLSSNNLQ